eukprot:SAG11_NODE_2679_length_3104_cov_3.342429_4_plen_242_part_00
MADARVAGAHELRDGGRGHGRCASGRRSRCGMGTALAMELNEAYKRYVEAARAAGSKLRSTSSVEGPAGATAVSAVAAETWTSLLLPSVPTTAPRCAWRQLNLFAEDQATGSPKVRPSCMRVWLVHEGVSSCGILRVCFRQGQAISEMHQAYTALRGTCTLGDVVGGGDCDAALTYAAGTHVAFKTDEDITKMAKLTEDARFDPGRKVQLVDAEGKTYRLSLRELVPLDFEQRPRTITVSR